MFKQFKTKITDSKELIKFYDDYYTLKFLAKYKILKEIQEYKFIEIYNQKIFFTFDGNDLIFHNYSNSKFYASKNITIKQYNHKEQYYIPVVKKHKGYIFLRIYNNHIGIEVYSFDTLSNLFYNVAKQKNKGYCELYKDCLMS